MEIDERKQKYIQDFNLSIVNFLEKIIEKGLNKINDIELFHLNTHLDDKKELEYVTIDKISYDENAFKKLKKLTLNDEYLGYYWVQFNYNNEVFKINMFFRGCDRETGNLHIFPGAIQIFKYVEKHNHSYIKNGRYWNVNEDITKNAYKCHNGSKQYSEEHWVPIKNLEKKDQDIPMLWNLNNVDEIADNFWKEEDFEDIYSKLKTISFVNIKEFFSLQGKYDDWTSLLYPKGTIGTQYSTAYHMFKFKTEKKEKQIHNYLIFEVENYGYFNMFDGKPHEYDYVKKEKTNEKYKELKYFWAGPNYIVENNNQKNDWEFVYKTYPCGMNKKIYINKLNSLNLDKNKYCIIASGSMLMYGLIETCSDIDIRVTKELFDELFDKYNMKQSEQYDYVYELNDEIDINSKNFDYNNIEIVDGYPVEKLEINLDWMIKNNRTKDKEKIEIIKKFLNK